MSFLLRLIVLTAALVVALPPAAAADVKSVDKAIDKGKEFLRAKYARNANAAAGNHGIGPAALVGVALLEARVPADDACIKTIAAAVREAAYSETKTYQTALCIIFLDKLEDPADVPMIQVLAMRLLAGQMGGGGWGYDACAPAGGDHVQWLKANLKAEAAPKDPKAKARMNPDALKYAASIQKPQAMPIEDNSNTQFAILGLWLARKHGVPVEPALDLIEKRFRASQDGQGSWAYIGGAQPTASMTCAGLLGLATGNARRIEKRPPPKETTLKTPMAKDDPFFNTPGKTDKPAEKAPELRDPAAMKALAALGAYLAAAVQSNAILAPNERHGDKDYYLLWSIERVGVIYNLDKLGGVDWYDVGSDVLIKAQRADGSWTGGNYGEDVNTPFALLFLCKADLLRDLSNKFRKDNELRAGSTGSSGSGSTDPAPMPKTPGTGATTPALPSPVEDTSTKLANQLVLAPATEWSKALENLRDAKGGEFTRGLVVAIRKLDGDRRKQAREALAERLTRMSAETLTGMMKGEDAELRRGAALAAAMKDDKAHVPDLIDRLLDDDDLVVRAAKAGLKSLTSQDFGPKPGATRDEAKAAVDAWKAWWAKNK